MLCCLTDANGELQLLPEPGAAWVVGSRGCKIREVGREHGKERVGVSAALPQQKSISATKSQSPGEARCCSGKRGCSCAEPACHPRVGCRVWVYGVYRVGYAVCPAPYPTTSRTRRDNGTGWWHLPKRSPTAPQQGTDLAVPEELSHGGQKHAAPQTPEDHANPAPCTRAWGREGAKQQPLPLLAHKPTRVISPTPPHATSPRAACPWA